MCITQTLEKKVDNKNDKVKTLIKENLLIK